MDNKSSYNEEDRNDNQPHKREKSELDLGFAVEAVRVEVVHNERVDAETEAGGEDRECSTYAHQCTLLHFALR